jgi:capsular polysaccharide transport system permease protein
MSVTSRLRLLGIGASKPILEPALRDDAFRMTFRGVESRPVESALDHVLILRALILHFLRVKYRNNPFGAVMEFFRPVVVCVAHYILFSFVKKAIPPQTPIEVFVLAGFSVWFAYAHSYVAAFTKFHGGSGFPGVTRMHIRIAKCAWEFFANIFFLYASVFCLKMCGDDIWIPDVPMTVGLFAITIALGLGVGLIWEAACRLAPVLEPFAHNFPWLVFVSAGIYFSLSLLPTFMADIFQYNPVLHLLELERYASDPGYPTALLSVPYAATCAALALLFGLLVNRHLRYEAPE